MWFSSLILSLRLLFQDQSLIVNDSWCISGEVFDISNVITLKKIQLHWLSICIYDNPNLNFSAKIQIFNFLKAFLNSNYGLGKCSSKVFWSIFKSKSGFLAQKFKLRNWQIFVKIWFLSRKFKYFACFLTRNLNFWFDKFFFKNS